MIIYNKATSIAPTAVATCVYGEKFLPMVLSFVESWTKQINRIYLIFCDIDNSYIEYITRTYPYVYSIEWKYSVSRSKNKKIPQKIAFWEELKNHIELSDDDFIVFADIDTIAIKELNGINIGDIVVTRRSVESHYFMNAGIVGMSKAALQSDLLRIWRQKTEEIINSPALLRQAISREFPYGAADQMALMHLLDLNAKSFEADYNGLTVKTVLCSEFNACENTIDAATARVIHLKTSIQSFLLRRRPFTGQRQQHDSLDQLRIAVSENTQGLAKLTGIPNDRKAYFRFKMPYFMKEDFTVPFIVLLSYKSAAHVSLKLGRGKQLYNRLASRRASPIEPA